MNRRCSNARCFVHDGEGCDEGKLDVAECPFWSADASKPEAALSPTETSARVLWSGSALGLTALANLVPRGRSILVGVLGAHDAGKTTLLAGNYLQLLRGHALADARFAGSRTLGAWESLAAWTRFEDAARLPSFPPHTPRGTSRVPGLLHLALRGPKDEFRDVLLTDAPGEWFTRWSVWEDAPEAEGARWIVRHADAFLVLADCHRLCSRERGQTRDDIRQLLERLGNNVRDRPTVLVWAKAVNQPPAGIRGAIQDALKNLIPHATEVESSIEQRETIQLALEAALRPAWLPPRARPVVDPILQHQPFAAFRGLHARS
jgi:hypothetical protein